MTTLPLRSPISPPALRSRFLLLLLGLSCVLLPQAHAVPITISFYQLGFTGGGYISRTLVGEDLNNNHIIDVNEWTGGVVSPSPELAASSIQLGDGFFYGSEPGPPDPAVDNAC